MKANRERVGRATSIILSVSLVMGILTHTPAIVKAQLTESFESGWGDWYPDMNYDPAYFNIDLSSLYAYDGSVSVGIGSHGLPSPPITGWVERIVPVPPSTPLTVDVSFQLYSEGMDTPREVLAYIGNSNPSDYPDFTVVGSTDQVADSWFEYAYMNSITTPPSGQIYVAVGTYNQLVGFKTYWVDYIVIGGITVDNDPPDITNLQPTNQTTIADNQPLIAANYTDASGVSVPSVVLEVDSVNVTSFATLTDSWAEYTPSAPLSEGVHNVYLEATDISSNQNTGVKTWWFTVDSLPPVISNDQPINWSYVGNLFPTIQADFTDATSGTDVTSVRLLVDSSDVTANSTVTPNSVTYIPSMALSEGFHVVQLNVGDNSAPRNMATKIWSFTVDTIPPIITNLRPPDQSYTNSSMPEIGAEVTDSSIGLGPLPDIRVDGFSVFCMLTVFPPDELLISCYPFSPLPDGPHYVYLSVTDGAGNTAVENWVFEVDTSAPITTLNVLDPKYTDIGGKTYVSSATPLNITWDDGSGIGAETVWYKDFALGEAEPGYSQYYSDFTIPATKPDGLIYVKFKSVDFLGNEESENQEALYLDNTAPVTDVVVGTPSHLDSGTTFVTSSTTLTLTGDDGSGSGVSEIMYGIDDPVCPNTYTLPVGLGSAVEGAHTIYVKAVDNVGNEEPIRTIDIYVDETAPVTGAVFGNPQHSDSGIIYVNSETSLDFSADDGAGSGTASTWYRVMKGGAPEIQWTEYDMTPVFLSGTDGLRQIVFKSTDNLGNEEPEQTVDIYLDTTNPTSSVPGIAPGATVYFNNTLSSIEIAATDGEGSGVEETKYGVDNPDCPSSYSGPIIVGTMSQGQHLIYFMSIDNVNNEEVIKNITIFLDIAPPVADAGEDLKVEVGEIFVVDGGSSTDGSGGSGIKSFRWSFIFEGALITSDNEVGDFIIEEEGTYIFTLTITDNAGNTHTDTVVVEVVSKADAAFPWWILALLIVVVVSMLLVFALFKKKQPRDEQEERECEECGHVLGPHDRVCPECDSPVAMASRR